MRSSGAIPVAVELAFCDAGRWPPNRFWLRGVNEAATVLASATADLEAVTRALDAAVKPLTHRYTSLATLFEGRPIQVERESNRLVTAADNSTTRANGLLVEVQSLHWHVYVAAVIAILLAGVWIGNSWQTRHLTDDVEDLRTKWSHSSKA